MGMFYEYEAWDDTALEPCQTSERVVKIKEAIEPIARARSGLCFTLERRRLD